MPATNELDAARECVMAYGLAHTTFSDIARRAGISRQTLYSRYTDLSTILAALIAHDFNPLINDSLAEHAHLPTARQRLVQTLTIAAQRMAQSQLFQRILEVDPQAILPYVIDHIGQTQRAVIAGTTKLITEGQTDHSIRQGNPHHMACAIELSLRSYVFSARATQPTCPRQTALTELHAMLDRYLAPHPDDHNIAAVTAGPHRP